MNFRKLLNLFEAGTLLLAMLIICPVQSTTMAAAQHPHSPAAKGQGGQGSPMLPPPGTYRIDPKHSFAYFSAWHHFVGRVRGRFDKVTGSIHVSQDTADCSVDVTIDVSTLSTQVSQRDDDLLSPEYFDVKKFPAMTYQGRGIRRNASGLWEMPGSLTIHGVTKIVPLTFRFNGAFPGTKSGEAARVAFHGSAATKRAQFGMGARDNLEEVGDSPAPDVEIEIDVEADANTPTQ